MSSAPFDHNLIIERLKDQVAVLESVGGAADFAAIKAVR
ncbi:phage tail terminator protein, partial [Pseudomonas aeruginosa]